MPLYTYVTPAQYALQAQSNEQIELNVPVAKMMQQARQITARVERMRHYKFVPKFDQQHYDAKGAHIDSALNVLLLNAPYISISAVRIGVTPSNAGTLLEADTDYAPYPREALPITALERVGSSWATGGLQSIRIEGVQGYHSAGAAAWIDTLDEVENNPLSSSATLIIVNDAGDADENGFAPRFSPGQLLRIEDEYIVVLAVDEDANTLTVKRGQNGTTAAAHVQNTAIKSWEVEPDLARACAREVGYRLTSLGAYQAVTFDGAVMTQFPADLLPETVNILRKYPNLQSFGTP